MCMQIQYMRARPLEVDKGVEQQIDLYAQNETPKVVNSLDFSTGIH